MRERPDAANGPEYDPHYRSSVWDFVPKHNSVTKCKPYYRSDDDPSYYEPTGLYEWNAIFHSNRVNTTPYVSLPHPYLYGLPRRWQGCAGGE